MLNQATISTQHTMFLTPVVPVATDTPIDEIRYSPSLLLPLPDLSSALVCDHEFVYACEYGYNDYFDSMVNDVDVFVYQNYTSAQVYRLIIENVCLSEKDRQVTTLPWCIGFVFGWLSALSKYQPRVANVGVEMLCSVARELEQGIHNTPSFAVVAHK